MKNKNSGFSLFTVLISVAFLSIMGLLLLYISVANFEMQTTDLKGKDSFYTAEQALEEIRTGLQEDVGNAMSEAYIYVMENYSTDESVTDESQADQRLSIFTEKYLNLLADALSGTTTSGTEENESRTYSLEKLNGYVDLEVSDSETLVVTCTTSPEMKVYSETGVLLKNLKVIYVDERGRSSIIQTDIRLGIPNIEFPTPSTLPDLMNMIVVAGGGIEIQSTDTTTGTGIVEIDGSAYAGAMEGGDNDGVSILVGSDQKLTISGGDQVVCEGEVKIEASSMTRTIKDEDGNLVKDENGNAVTRKASTFETAEGVNLWASGITLSSATLNLLGKTYIADDLTVESGSGSYVTISGEYYGYGSPTSARKSHNNYCESTGLDPIEGQVGVLNSVSDTSLSSAIVINGKNTTLDLSDLEKLMLAGKSYVSSPKDEDGGSDILMGESLTVKGTQIAYLLPSELLKSGTSDDDDSVTLTNPMSIPKETDESKLTATKKRIKEIYKSYTNNDFTFIDETKSVDAWGGKTIKQIGVDENAPVTAVITQDEGSGGNYMYFYLNFTDESKAAEFMQNCYSKNSEVKDTLDRYLAFYFPNTGTGITMKDSNSYLSYITAGNYLISGNVLTYSGASSSDGSAGIGTGNLLEGLNGSIDLTDTQVGYQNMWFALKRKMIGSYDLLEKEVVESEADTETGTQKQIHDERDATRTVFDNLVNEADMVAFVNKYHNTYEGITDENNNGQQYWFVNEGSVQAVFANNGSTGYNKELVIDTTLESTLRLVVCTGDVRIKSGVEFKGIIMTKGKIILESGLDTNPTKLTSEPTEAAIVFQAQISAITSEDSEIKEVAPRDFFWDGEDYVLGSSSSSSTAGSSGSQTDTYDISSAITYENWKKM